MKRLLILTTTMLATSASAMTDPKSVDQAISPAVPEPGAAILFAAAGLMVLFVLRRRQK